jgi:hypothetical protein
MSHDQEFEKQDIYQIKLLGQLKESWSDWLGGMAITSEHMSSGLSITTLVGVVDDQAKLRGILCKIWDLNLVVIAVNRINRASNDEDTTCQLTEPCEAHLSPDGAHVA